MRSVTPMPTFAWIFRARVLRVIDADSLHILLDCGFNIALTGRIRLLDVDAPELRGEEREAGLAAKQAVEEWLARHDTSEWPLLVESVRYRKDGFGRYLIRVWAADDPAGPSLNAWLLETGNAVPYGS